MNDKKEKKENIQEINPESLKILTNIYFQLLSFSEPHQRKRTHYEKEFSENKAWTNLDISTASLSVPRKAPSSFAIIKFLVSLFIPIPSVIVSNGFFSLRPSASSLVYITPLVILLNKPEPGGSIRKHLMFGFFS